MIKMKKVDNDTYKYLNYKDDVLDFVEFFNMKTGFYMRTGLLDMNRGEIVDTGIDPFKRSYPNLLDIGIMGAPCRARFSCKAQCYQGEKSRSSKDMSFETFKAIIDQSKGKVQQIALGGSGNPDDHEYFDKILYYARKNGIIPSYTTSGINVNEKTARITKENCGAVAVSWQHDHSYRDKAIELFIEAGCITNVHFVVSNKTINEAIWQLNIPTNEENKNRTMFGTFPKSISNVIFLTHKPIGNANSDDMLRVDDPRIKELAKLIDNNKASFGVGVDACMVPLLLNHCENINKDSISSCDASTYSAYVTADNWLLPCSMDVHDYKYGIDLSKNTMQEAWDSELFNSFRSKLSGSCIECKSRLDCFGGCHLIPKMSLCDRKERTSNDTIRTN